MADEPVSYRDKDFRRAERARISRLNRLPGPLRTWADGGRPQAVLVALLQAALVIAVGLGLLKVLTGEWLPRYAALVVLALAVASQAVCRAVNKRADARAAQR